MKWRPCLLALAWLAFPALANALDTASCSGKRGWQRSIVKSAVHSWFWNDAQPQSLMQLIQAEHGIVACAPGTGLPSRLHTTTLSPGLALDQLGAVLLSNELEWSGLMPRPEVGLAGRFFRVSPIPASVNAPGRSDPSYDRVGESGTGLKAQR